MKVLQYTLRFIGLVQIVLGLIFLFVPNQFASAIGLEIPPAWVLWMFGDMGARFLGFGIGMFVAANDPVNNRSWIVIMAFIQVIDWIYAIYHLTVGSITISQAATAPVFPIFFVGIISFYLLRTTTIKELPGGDRVFLSRIESGLVGWIIGSSRNFSYKIVMGSFLTAILILVLGFNPINSATQKTGYSLIDFLFAGTTTKMAQIITAWGPNLVDRMITTLFIETLFVASHAILFLSLLNLLYINQIAPGKHVMIGIRLILSIAAFDFLENLLSIVILASGFSTVIIAFLFVTVVVKFLLMFTLYGMMIFLVINHKNRKN